MDLVYHLTSDHVSSVLITMVVMDLFLVYFAMSNNVRIAMESINPLRMTPNVISVLLGMDSTLHSPIIHALNVHSILLKEVMEPYNVGLV
jgi:hypothetical protein